MSNQLLNRFPSLFIPHGGGPCFFMDWTWGPPDTWHSLASWLGHMGESLGVQPKAVVVISGHWEETEFTVGAHPNPLLIYDYYGFPEHTYKLQYPAPGSPVLAQRIRDLLAAAGIPSRSDPARGFDHGVFIPFKLIYPAADIPIVQLSLKAGLDPGAHLAAGQAIQSLRQQEVLIVGSGMSYHNMRGFGGGGGADVASRQFDAWLTDAVCAPDAVARSKNLGEWRLAPAARASHPREEHLLPSWWRRAPPEKTSESGLLRTALWGSRSPLSSLDLRLRPQLLDESPSSSSPIPPGPSQQFRNSRCPNSSNQSGGWVMSNAVDRLALCEAILSLIERKRAETGDESLGASIERAVLDTQFQELEQEILENPGAFEPWLIRRRRGEA